MAQQLYFSRDTKVYIEIGSAIWEIPVLDGYSFSQATNASEITLAEMANSSGTSRRGRRAFNDSLAPAEWSFSTYVRPFISAGTGSGAADSAANHHAVEEVLWALMVGSGAYSTFAFTQGLTSNTSNLTIDFDDSNKPTLGTASIYFVLGNANKTTYKLSSAVVNEASIDFDIDGLATINWSGFASTLTEASAPTATIYEKITATDNFIRNRLSTLAVDGSATTGLLSSYNLTLTGGNITISNNITYITPEELGIVNVPVGHVTGTRSISGNFTCYLNNDTSNNDGSTDFWEDISGLSSVVTNDVSLTFTVGGSTAPKLAIVMPNCHVEVPTHDISDVISVTTNFMSLPSTIDDTDEATLTYTGA